MRFVVVNQFALLLGISLMMTEATSKYNILLATMGGTKSHTVPFVALGTSLRSRGHNVTLLSAFSGPAANNGLHELVPPVLEQACVKNITSKWDLVGARFRNEFPILPLDVIKYIWKTCKSLVQNATLLAALRKPGGDPQRRWDVVVLDGIHTECLLAILHNESVPIILLNTLARYNLPIALQGNPSPWSVTPFFIGSTTQDMTFFQRILNVAALFSMNLIHWFTLKVLLQPNLEEYLGNQVPDLYSLMREIPLTLQNNHYSVGDSVPYMSNVVNVVCLQCRPAKQLNSDLDSFLRRGFVYVSMGSLVQASKMPETLRQIFVEVFSTLPYNVVWKWEGGKIKDLPGNVRTGTWWSQQELLGHPELRAFVSHGGLLSLHEAAYHGVPTLVLPIFCEQDGNAAQAEKLGYALVMELSGISIDALREGIIKVAALQNNSYREAAKKRSALIRDHPIGPRELATWWVEHVAKHGGADHLKSSTRYMGVMHYYCLDIVLFICLFCMLNLIVVIYVFKKWCWPVLIDQNFFKKKGD